MKKKNVWVANDGTEFNTQEEAIQHEQHEGYRHAVEEFVTEHFELTEDEAVQLVASSDAIWNLIRDNAEEFQEVLNLAKPRKRRGRPPGTSAKKKKPKSMRIEAKDAVDSPAAVIAQAGAGTSVPDPDAAAALPPAAPPNLEDAQVNEDAREDSVFPPPASYQPVD